MISLSGELTVALHGALKKADYKALANTSDFNKALKEAQDVIDEAKKIKDIKELEEAQTKALKEAEETKEALKHLEEAAGVKKKKIADLIEMEKMTIHILNEKEFINVLINDFGDKLEDA